MYSDRFGKKFNNNLPDWPHNPLITVLLYSGFTGFVMYIILILKTCHLYYAYRRRIGIVIMGFAMTFFFSFFSGSNPFDPPIMGFFIVFPFFIHSINKSDNPINNAQNSDNR
jgi:O-antigen ligase